MNVTEHLVKESDNIITMTLTEDDVAVTGSWTQIDVHMLDLRDASVLTITRTSEADGIGFSSGILTITPGDLTEDLSVLNANNLYRSYIQVTSSSALNGDYFGGSDTNDTKLYLYVTDPP